MTVQDETALPTPVPAATLRYDGLAVLVVLAVTGVLYGHTFNAPWYLDDRSAILENPQVRDLAAAALHLLTPRGVTLFTFAMNYRLGEFAPPLWHLANITIHAGSGVLVYLLARRILVGKRQPLALLAALLFVAHPLQTQSVTYVVQRMTSLSGAFFLAALLFFVIARTRRVDGVAATARAYLLPYGLALLCATLACYSKETAVVLPLALVLYVRTFVPADRDWRGLLLAVAPFALVPCWLVLQQVALPLLGGAQLAELGAAEMAVGQQGNTPLRYLMTEFGVLWFYLRLILLPYGQRLDYGYPLVEAWHDPLSLLALAGWLGLGGLAWYRRRQWPRLAFGVGWFLLTLVVESSILPLDTVFEHRLYLPLFGLVLAACVAVPETLAPSRWLPVAGLVLLLLGGLTWQRNQLWNDAVAFYEDNQRKSPDNERVLYDLGRQYVFAGRFDAAEQVLRRALELNPKFSLTYIHLPQIYILQQRYDEAIAVLRRGIEVNPNEAFLYTNLGYVYVLKGDTVTPEGLLRQALQIDPNFVPAYFNLARLLGMRGDLAAAERYQRDGLARVPDDAGARIELAQLLARQGRGIAGLNELRAALRRTPQDRALAEAGRELAANLGDTAAVAEFSALLERLPAPPPASGH